MIRIVLTFMGSTSSRQGDLHISAQLVYLRISCYPFICTNKRSVQIVLSVQFLTYTGTWDWNNHMWLFIKLPPILYSSLPPPHKNLFWTVFKDVSHSNSLPCLQCSISMNAAGIYLIAGLYWDRQLMGTVASPEVCLYSQSRFLYSCDILTTSEVSQLFRGINNGNGSPYLTFTVQAAYFVVVILYLFGLSGEVLWASSLFVALFSFLEWFRGVFVGAAVALICTYVCRMKLIFYDMSKQMASLKTKIKQSPLSPAHKLP